MKRLLFSVQRLHIKLFIAVVIVLAATLYPVQISAQNKPGETIAIGVTPAIIEVAAYPGEKIERTLTISNQTGFSLPVSIEEQSLINTDEIINPVLRKQFDGAEWVKAGSDAFIMSKNEIKEMPVVISVPENATPGGHYAQLSIRGLTLENDDLKESSSSIVVPEISVSVFITVAGYINERLEIQDSDIFGLIAELGQEKIISFGIENRGNVHALVVPTLLLEKDGKEYSKKRLTPKVVLPNSIKQFEETWQVPDEGGVYTAKIIFSYGNELSTVSSLEEKVVAMPELWKLGLLAVGVFSAMYIFGHRKNLKAAYEVLVAKA